MLNKLRLSPAATAVAAHVLRMTTSNSEPLVCSDDEFAAHTGLKPDTCYRAIVELVELGALADTPRRDGIRTIVRHDTHWLWSALIQEGAAS